MTQPNAPQSEKHVIYGAGPVGTAVARTLAAQGKRVSVVTRSGARKHLPKGIEVVAGDATDPGNAREVCRGATHVYNCTNAPDYHRWPEQFPPLQAGVLAGAAAAKAKLIVMENLYMYGPHRGAPITEDLAFNGNGSRSSTRVRMTRDLFDAHRAGVVRAVSVRAADLFGPGVTESLVGERFFEALLAGRPAQVFADPDLPHSISFVDDVGQALVNVGADDRALGKAWLAPNAPTVTLRRFADLVGQELGSVPKLSAMPRLVTRLLLPVLALTTPALRGLEENLYIGYEPYIVDHARYAGLFGDHATPLAQAIRTTVAWYRAHAATTAGVPELSRAGGSS